jgi:hypothetical protein
MFARVGLSDKGNHVTHSAWLHHRVKDRPRRLPGRRGFLLRVSLPGARAARLPVANFVWNSPPGGDNLCIAALLVVRGKNLSRIPVMAKKPIDLAGFMKKLEKSTDPARLEKALSMLKADRFQLFARIEPESLVGVVKSQTDASLVYSCRLAADGTFACCTQNLNACGGLRGALCKHLMVLIVGLTQSGVLDPTTIDLWVGKSRKKKPELDKDIMSEVFLRYKGAESGEVDWRPTETIPEDYYAY